MLENGYGLILLILNKLDISVWETWSRSQRSNLELNQEFQWAWIRIRITNSMQRYLLTNLYTDQVHELKVQIWIRIRSILSMYLNQDQDHAFHGSGSKSGSRIKWKRIFKRICTLWIRFMNSIYISGTKSRSKFQCIPESGSCILCIWIQRIMDSML